MKKDMWWNVARCILLGLIGVLFCQGIYTRFAWGQYLWILGAFAGAGLGWFAGDPGELRTSIVRAWETTTDWRPNKAYWKAAVSLEAGLMVSTLSSCMITFAPIPFVKEERAKNIASAFAAAIGTFSFFATVILVVIMISAFFFCRRKGMERDNFLSADVRTNLYESRMRRYTKTGLSFLKFGNPLVLPFFALWWTGSSLWENREDIIDVAGGLSSLVAQCFVKAIKGAHSTKRRIRATSIFLGIVAGFFFGGVVDIPIWGAVAGGLLSGVFYKVGFEYSTKKGGIAFIPAHAG